MWRCERCERMKCVMITTIYHNWGCYDCVVQNNISRQAKQTDLQSSPGESPKSSNKQTGGEWGKKWPMIFWLFKSCKQVLVQTELGLDWRLERTWMVMFYSLKGKMLRGNSIQIRFGRIKTKGLLTGGLFKLDLFSHSHLTPHSRRNKPSYHIYRNKARSK